MVLALLLIGLAVRLRLTGFGAALGPCFAAERSVRGLCGGVRPAGRGGDMIRKGAFAESLKRGGEVPLLWQHKAGR